MKFGEEIGIINDSEIERNKHTTLYVAYIGSLGQSISVSIESFQIRFRSGASCYLSIKFPYSDTVINSITALPESSIVSLYVRRYYNDELLSSEELIQVDFDSVSYIRTGDNETITVAGYRVMSFGQDPDDSWDDTQPFEDYLIKYPSDNVINVSGMQSKALQESGKLKYTLNDVSMWLRPNDIAYFDNGDAIKVGYITMSVSADIKSMEVEQA
jgi:hypothetical protein